MKREVNIIALVKDTSRFVYVYDDMSMSEVLDAIRDHAADPQMGLSWYDECEGNRFQIMAITPWSDPDLVLYTETSTAEELSPYMERHCERNRIPVPASVASAKVSDGLARLD